MPGGPNGRREVPREAADDLDGIWVATALGDASSVPPTPLAWELVSGDVDLLAEALARRGAALPRKSRRLVAIGGHAYHAFLPLARAARELLPLDAELLSLAIAAEAREALTLEARAKPELSIAALVLLSRRIVSGVRQLEQRVLTHERDASQHYRWLVEMDLGILPDDALGTTIGECVAIQRATRALEIDASLDLVSGFASLTAFARRLKLEELAAFAAAALVPDALDFASVTPALSLWSGIAARGGALDADALVSLRREFVDAFGERGPREREPRAPRWSESPAHVERLIQSLVAADPSAGEARRRAARQAREERVDDAIARASFVDATTLRLLIQSLRRLVSLRSRLHVVRARTLAMLRTAALDVDRRLVRLAGTRPESAFFLSLPELMASTSRPAAEHAEHARARREAFRAACADAPPNPLQGHDALDARSKADGPSSKPLTGVGLGGSPVTGPITVAADFTAGLALSPGGVLVVRSLDPGWAPLFAIAGAVVSDAGGITEEGALAASALGVPLVLGVRSASERLAAAGNATVDARAGTVKEQ
jgi:phosphohistidine swiveling domain-containing protein